MYTYKAFGLIVESEFNVPELFSVNDSNASVRILYATFNHELDLEKEWFKLDNKTLTFVVERVGAFRVTNGDLIEVDRFVDATDEDVRLFLLGSAFGGLLHQRGVLPLHASAVEINGEAILFTADSGLGKSTTCLAFNKRGYNVVSDDICVLDFEDNKKLIVYPGYPQVKLWEESLAYFNEQKSNHRRIRPWEEKYGVSVKSEFIEDFLPVKAIFVLNKEADVKAVQINELQAFDKVINMQRNVFRPFFVSDSEQMKLNFKNIVLLANEVPIYKITRPEEGFTVDMIVDKIEELI